MKVTRVSRKYAKALFEVIEDPKKAREVLTQLQQVSEVLEKDHPELSAMLAHPRITSERKSALIQKVFGSYVDKQGLRLLELLAGRNRLDKLPGILVLLDEKQKQELLHKLGTKTGRWIDLTVHVDPALIGGLVIQVGDHLIDGSVRTQLQNLREGLKSLRIG